MPKAIQSLQALVKDEKISGKSKLETIKKMDSVLGLDLLKKDSIEIPKEVLEMILKKIREW